ncbi:polyprenyl diphosphate synthase [Gemmatimonas sp.]|uniref:polyprenyl diphosphate synthase n=1 Tax=Gemmatimonas sp. TaxID=1962908 RepID=UPI003340D20B
MRKLARGIVAPGHIALVLDGNRRWAQARGFSDVRMGHSYGEKRVHTVLAWCESVPIPVVTLFVISLDNLKKRSEAEVDHLYDVVEGFLESMQLQERWALTLIGRLQALPSGWRTRCQRLCDATRQGRRPFQLNLLVAYDGLCDIVDTAADLAGRSSAALAWSERTSTITVAAIDDEMIKRCGSHPDLVIRTGAETRLSGFMPWQTHGSAVYFSPYHWPDLTVDELNESLKAFQKLR